MILEKISYFPMNKKTIKLGIIGAGTVGKSLIQILEKEQERIYFNHGLKIIVHKIADRSYNKKEFLKSYNATNNIEEVINDSEIDIVVELIGGIDPAKEIILNSLKNKKSVVTANKALLANKGKEIFLTLKEIQRENPQITVGFEASVGGALPIIKNLRRIWSFGEIQSIYGILNGTCNFILTQMEEGMDYDVSLKIAQEKGFAEADPSFDVSGRDAGQKLAIISSLAFSTWIEEKQVIIEGIQNLQKVDFEIARKMNKIIRLLAILKKIENKLLLRVHPTLLPKENLLSDVKNEYNAIQIIENYSSNTFIVGKGAGGNPTATAVLADIVSIGSGSSNPWFNEFKHYSFIEDGIYKFYLRFQTVDKPGVLAAISTVLANFQISIAYMHQEEGTEPVNVIILTHECKESAIFSALKIINERRDIILLPTVVLRVI